MNTTEKKIPAGIQRAEEVGILNGRLTAVQAATAELFVRGLLTVDGRGHITAQQPRRFDSVSALQEGVLAAVRLGRYPLHSAPEVEVGLNALQTDAVEKGRLNARPRTWRTYLSRVRAPAFSLSFGLVFIFLVVTLADNSPTDPQADQVAASRVVAGIAALVAVIFLGKFAYALFAGPRRRTGKANAVLRTVRRRFAAPEASGSSRHAANRDELPWLVAIYGAGPLLAVFPASQAFGWRPVDVPAPRRAVPPVWDNRPQTHPSADGWSSASAQPVADVPDARAWRPEQIAILNGHLTTVQTATASLVTQGLLTTDQRGGLHVAAPHPLTPLTELETAVLKAALVSPTHIERSEKVRKAVGQLQKEAVAARLLRAPRKSIGSMIAGMLGRCFVAGAIITALRLPIASALGEQDPQRVTSAMLAAGLGWVVVMLSADVVTLIVRRLRPRRTGKGIATLVQLRGVHRQPFTLLRPHELPYSVALYGSRPLLMALPALAACGWVVQDIPDPSVHLSAQYHHSSGGGCGGGSSASDYDDDAWCSAGDACGSGGCGDGDGGGDGGGCGGCGGD